MIYTKCMCNTKARYSRITASLQIKKDNIFGIFRIGRGDGLGKKNAIKHIVLWICKAYNKSQLLLYSKVEMKKKKRISNFFPSRLCLEF